ncbi:hypothetical protein BDV18DRAFT_158214 [Aspergillus unguis]
MARPQEGQVVAWYVCTVVAVLFLVARLAVRWRLIKRFYLDDWFVAAATGCLIADLGIQHYMFNQGMSDPNASIDHVINQMKMIIPGSTLYVTSLWLIKASMVIFYKRLADRTRYQIIYNITLGLLAATWLVLFFDIVFKCFPPNRQWKGLTDPSLTCPDIQVTINFWLTILFNIFSDVFIICLPITQVVRLKMPPKQKWGVISVFLLGFLVVVASIIRAIFSARNEQMITCTVSMIETSVAIIAACLPVLRTLVFASHSRTGTYSKRKTYELSSSGPSGGNTNNSGSGYSSKAGRTTVSISRSIPETSFGSSSETRVESRGGEHGGDVLSRQDSDEVLVNDIARVSGPGIAVTQEYSVHEGVDQGLGYADGQGYHAR